MGIKGKSGGRGGEGEIVEVEGGHIIRAMGRKDRHSKVFTAKGPRDRRVRLSAHTAIQFYDVQDRLGFDRPSKAVDWLMSKAKGSIDKLPQLPPLNPPQDFNNYINNNNNCTDDQVPVPDRTESIYHQDDEHDGNGVGECMKSFFPINTTTHQQDLCLSLHTSDYQGPGPGTHSGLGLFPGPGSMGFDSGSNTEWGQHHDLGRFTRMMGWNGGQFPQQLGFHSNNSNNNNNFQGGTLQSSFYPLLGQPQGLSGPGSGTGSFMGFCNPELLHGGGGELSNRASSSSLSPEDSSQH